METITGAELREMYPNPRFVPDAAVERLRESYWIIEREARLFIGTDVADNSELFARSFQVARKQVSSEDRDAIVAKWASTESMLYPLVPCITMGTQTQWPGECTNGIFLRFSSEVVANMPAELVLPLIGHELGHTRHYVGQRRHMHNR